MKEGYDKAYTNRIAAAAGMSIGSLYQYFPSKEALVAALIDRHTQELTQVVRDALIKVPSRSIEVAAYEFVSLVSSPSRSLVSGASKISGLSTATFTHFYEAISRLIATGSVSPIWMSRPLSA